MANNIGHSVHPFFLPKHGPATATGSYFDQNEGRRKRQRTISPEAELTRSGNSTVNGWADQLKAAALQEPSAPAAISSPYDSRDGKTEGNINITHGEMGTESKGGSGTQSLFLDNGDNVSLEEPETLGEYAVNEELAQSPLKKVLRVRPDGKLGSPKAKVSAQDAMPLKKVLRVRPDSKLGSLKTKEPTGESTPPKKMLKVRPDGKLGSPKAGEAAQETKQRRNKKATKDTTAPKKLVASVVYGIDDGSRITTGRKIEDIMSGQTTKASPVKAEPSRPAGPPKPTHPFFLGETLHATGQSSSRSGDEVKKVEIDISSPAQQRKGASPRKARVTSKPAGVGLADSAAGAISFGRNTFGSDHARVSRFPGAMEPIWPPQGMLHVGRQGPSILPDLSPLHASSAPNSRRNMKSAEIKVSGEEEVLRPWLGLVDQYQMDRNIPQRAESQDRRQFRRPRRRLMMGQELQRFVCQEMRSKISTSDQDSRGNQDVDELSTSQKHQQPAHKALGYVFGKIATSLPAFDRFECETQDWVHKYAPNSAEHVLQQGREAILLRDWLRNLTVTSVENRDSGARDSSASRKLGPKASRKKRRRLEELDDFVVSSDEEASQMDEIADPEESFLANSTLKKSIMRSGNTTGSLSACDRSANAVVISGAHGCGKTAAVYAVAHELGFEVFEINAGSRRSGKDILDKVGDMTRNHLVKHASDEETAASKEEREELKLVNDKLKQDVESGRQGTMTGFFKSKGPAKENQHSSKGKAPKAGPKKCDAPKKQQSQKQSLILLEEVDVLFEEDKTFWATTLELILQSKRPIIMTCTDESLVPWNDTVLYAVLRFTPPSEQLATDYLLLVACNEGHLLTYDTISTLYKAKGSDLRASMTELNFFCQMAIGDTKGGLEWMLIKSATGDYQGQKHEPVRVVSEGTYESGMGWFNVDCRASELQQSIDEETGLLLEVWNGWGIDVGASNEYLSAQTSSKTNAGSRDSILQTLQDFELATEALSVADVFPACVTRQTDMAVLETAIPEVTEKMRSNYIEGSNVLLADPLIDYSGLTELLALTLRVYAIHLHHQFVRGHTLTQQSMTRIIPEVVQRRRLGRIVTKQSVSAAFDPIARSTKAVLGVPKGPQISSFDGPMSVITEDLGPYVRHIASCDLKLEEQRRILSSLLSEPGRRGKRIRTTRASRAALEGGHKAHTRRERWFPNNANLDLILQSGGKGWQDVLQRIMTEAFEEVTGSDLSGSRRSSLGSAMESDI